MPMQGTLEQVTGTGFPGAIAALHPGKQRIAWWTDQVAQAYQFTTFACLYPSLATLQHLSLLYGEVSALEDAVASQQNWYWESLETFFRDERPQGTTEGFRPQPSQMPGVTQGNLEELGRALQEFEESKGDWSKSR
jgi:hypothetical protein